ncbi:hypothetical protein V5O48_014085 [Marasmius crinis-equi]|uniref:NACHT domain-containing protein n=1 Tax=Marasmius crinis-equi TaxID=585013 RepID=A0ABR3EYD0_9AGAR
MSRYTYFDILSPYLDDWMYSITKLEKVFRLEARGWVLESYGGMIQIHNLPHARGPESGCLDGTRTDLIRTIGDWIETPSERSRICWVRGGAGTGKSAIAQTLCEKYLHIHLAANFSFSRNDRTRNGLDSLIPTIAYQLATEPAFQQAGLASFIDEAIPRAVDWGWEFERLFKQLITDPCLRVDPNRWKDLPTVIIIDGLDECNEEERQQEKLLSVIHESTFALPIRFVIFSRPEPTILNFFRTTPSISTTAHELDMRDFRAEADRDIKVYLYHRFAFVRSSYPEVIVGDDWPGEEAIQRLAHKADAHFVYVVTAVNYIARKDSSPPLPQQRLDAVLRGEKNSLYPDLTDLDQLFHHILQSVMETHELTLLPVLQLLITPHYRPRNDGQLPPGMPTLEIKWRTRYAMGRLLNMDPHQVASVLSGLYSVLYIPDGNEHDGDVAFLHAPFSDFLRDERRSHRFHVKPIETWSDVPRRRRRSFASRPKKSHSSSISISPSSSFPSPTEFPDSPDALGYFDRLLPYLDDWRNAISRLKELSEQENREEESRIQITRMSILL